MGCPKIGELTILYREHRLSELDDDISMANVEMTQSFLNDTFKRTGTR